MAYLNKTINNTTITQQGLIEEVSKTFDEITKPVMKLLEPIGEVAGALGFNMLDNPTIGTRYEATRIQSQSNLNEVVGVNRAISLTVDPKGTAVTPIGAHKDERIGGITDLMGIPIAARTQASPPVEKTINTWTTGDLPGKLLFVIPIGPLYEMWNRQKLLHPLSTFASAYDLWRGSFIIDIEFWHTPFNKGSFAAAFWNFEAGQLVTSDLTRMTHANLAQGNLAGNNTRLRIRLPFKHQLERLKVYDGSPYDQCFTGSLGIYTLTTLQTKQGFPEEVPFVVRVSSDDLVYSNHSMNQAVFFDYWGPATGLMSFTRPNYPVSEGKENSHSYSVKGVKRQGDEGAVEDSKDVYHEAGYGKAVEDVIKPVERLRLARHEPSHSTVNVAQREWDIRKIFSQAHVLDSIDIALPTSERPIAFYPMPNSAMVNENCTPCIVQNFRFYSFNKVRVSLALNTMNGVAGAGFMVYLRGIVNQIDAESLLNRGLQQIIDINGGVVFSLSTDREIHMDCKNVYPLNNFSVDTKSPCGMLVVGLYTDTILGVGQTGYLNFTIKTSIDGFEIREPNYNPSASYGVHRQGDHEVIREAHDEHQTDAIETTIGTKSDVIHVNPFQEKVPSMKNFANNHTDHVMSFEQCKRYERVWNEDISEWSGQVFDVWQLITTHKFIYLVLRMVRFAHFGLRFKVRIVPNEGYGNNSYMVGFRGMFGAPTATDMLYLNDSMGNLVPQADGGGNRGAVAEMQANTVGEQLDFEIPYTSPTKTLVINGISNATNHLGYDMGSFFVSSNRRIAAGTLVIYAALSDDCTFSCPVDMLEGNLASVYPNSVPPELTYKRIKQKQQQENVDSDSDMEVISVRSQSTHKKNVGSQKFALK